MAARWIGLARPQHISFSAPRRRTRRGSFLRGLGAAGVLGGALCIAGALHPHAYAQTLAVLEEPLSFFTEANSVFKPLPLESAAPIALDEDEVHLLAATAWGEARSEGEHGMRAVAHVMVNRVGQRFGDDLRSVILSPRQFSVWNRGDPNRPLVQNPAAYATAGDDAFTWEAAQKVAREVLSGQSVDPTAGALFYHTRAIRPWWARYGHGRQEIGAHVFYADVPDQRPRVTAVTSRPMAPLPPLARETPDGRVSGVLRE